MPMSDLYRELILEHWRKPRHSEPLAQPTNVSEVVNESCGDSARVELVIRDGEIFEVSVQVSGCALATAAGSVVAEAIVRKPIATALALSEQSVVALMGGITSTSSRTACLMLGTQTLQQALETIPERQLDVS